MGRSRGLAFLIVVALQVLALLGFVGVREFTLRTGREIVLQTVPVDPRELFRGDYVVLRYEISTLPSDRFNVGDTVYVLLAQREGVWTAVRGVVNTPPSSDQETFIRGRVTRVWDAQTDRGRVRLIGVEYGIESYFVPEGTGREIERAQGKVKVMVAVDRFGTAVIKEVMLDE